MARTRLAALLLVPLAFMLMGARTVLVDPEPIAVPAGHGNYMKWVRNMQGDIQRELQLLTVK